MSNALRVFALHCPSLVIWLAYAHLASYEIHAAACPDCRGYGEGTDGRPCALCAGTGREMERCGE